MIAHAVLVFLNVWPHVGEPAVVTGRKREVDGVAEAEVRLVYCEHLPSDDRTVWITRDHIK